jgi:hypothetical protein
LLPAGASPGNSTLLPSRSLSAPSVTIGFADLQAAGDGNALAFGRPGLDLAHAHRAVRGDDVYK